MLLEGRPVTEQVLRPSIRLLFSFTGAQSFDPDADEGVGEVVVRHEVSSDDVYTVLGETFLGDQLVISSFDSENETFEIHVSNPDIGYNAEIAGRALFFEVTIINVAKV